MIVEGKFDTVMGRDVLVTTGRYGFRTYDVRDASHPRLLDSYQPPEILGENGYWQDEDMEIDRRRKLIIGSLDPRHDDVDQASCPGIGTLGAKNRNPKCRSGFYVISYANPRQPGADRRLRRAARGPHDELRRPLQLRVDGRPGAPGRPRLPRPLHAGRARGRAPDLGDGPPGPGPPEAVPEADRPRPQRRRDGLLARRQRRRATGSRGSAAAAGCSATRRKGQWRDPKTDRVRRATPWNPVLVAGGGLPGGDKGVAQPQTDFIHNANRPTDGRVRAKGVRKGNIALMTEEDFTGPTATRAAGSSPRTSRARSAVRGRRTRRPRSRSG